MRKALQTLAAVLILVLIAVALPLAAPRLMGLQMYHVLTESMTPVLPVDSVIYVKRCDPAVLETGDVVTYTLGSIGLVETHRVVGNDSAAKQLVTKGDANAQDDIDPVAYDRVVGKVILCLPYLGAAAQLLQTRAGLMVCAVVFALAGLLWALADKCEKGEKHK